MQSCPELDRIHHHHATLVKNIAFEKYICSWMSSRSFNIIVNKTRKKYGELTFSKFMHEFHNERLEYGEDAFQLILYLMNKFEDDFQ